jgi:hypothetical protein
VSEQPVTYTDVAHNLSMLSRELAAAAHDMGKVERTAVQARHAHTIAYAKAYLVTANIGKAGRAPSIPEREAAATVATADESLAAELAEGELRTFRGYVNSLRTRIDCARSGGTLLRAELELDKVR